MNDYYENDVLTGKTEGKPGRLRGYAVKYKIWNCIASNEDPVTIQDIMDSTTLSRHQVRQWVEIWQELDYLYRKNVAHPTSKFNRPYAYWPHEDAQEMPNINKHGADIPLEQTQMIWNTIRGEEHKDLFDINTVLKAIGEPNDTSKDFCTAYLRKLFLAGYLIKRKKDGRDFAYSLKHDTGELAPSVLRGKQVFDPNIMVIVN